MKRILALLCLLSLFAFAGTRKNITITIAAGTPVQISKTQVFCDRVLIQMQHGGTGIGYVMAGIAAGRTPSTSTSSDLSAELAPATATAPGGSYSDTDPKGGIDLSQIWVDGSHTGDTMLVSYSTVQ